MSKDGVFTSANLEELFFDPDNPRLPPAYKDEGEAAVLKYMIREENVVDLMQSIGETDYSDSEPLLIAPREKGDGYIVVEGNRRLAALRLLSDPTLAPVRQSSVRKAVEEANVIPKSVPVISYANRTDILDYLGYRHITGVKNWGALEKARYLKQLYDLHKDPSEPDVLKKLAKMIGSRSDYVGKLLVALKLYERANDDDYYGIEIEEKDVNFSLLSTAISYENIYRFIGLQSSSDPNFAELDKDNFAFLFAKLYDPDQAITDSRQLSQLSEVIASDRALEQYKLGASLSDAVLFTDAPIKTFAALLSEARKKLASADRVIKSIDSNSVPSDGQYTRILLEIENTARGILGILGKSDT